MIQGDGRIETERKTVLLVDDEESILLSLKLYVQHWGYAPLLANTAREAIEILKTRHIDLIISDQEMPEMNGIELLYSVRKIDKDIPFIIMTAYGSIDKAVISLKEGADDYIQKPYNVEELHAIARHLLSYYSLSREYKELKDYMGRLYSFKNIVTRSAQMMNVLALAGKVSKVPDTTVAIYGESGTGKEVLARAIHFASGIKESRFVAVNCAGIPSNLLESELFGHVKGAFTGAERDRDGKFDLAQQGTILLDEIGDMPLDLQAKLLRVIQERVYERVGSNRQVRADMRVITTTHRDLRQLVKEGRFREDLFHRINSFPITLPPLRERKEDIPILVDHFLNCYRSELGKQIPGISEAAIETLLAYRWPGNVRELKNCIERAVILIDGELIRPNHLNIEGPASKAEDAYIDSEDLIGINLSFKRSEFSLSDATDRILQIILSKCGNNKTKAAELLKVDRKMFYRKK